MRPALLLLSFLFAIGTCCALAQTSDPSYALIGSAYLDNRSFSFLQHLCDEAGGRLLGSANNEKALGMLKDELSTLGCEARLERFNVPGWVRAEDAVAMVSPTVRKLRAVALGYVDSCPTFEEGVVDASYGFDSLYSTLDAKGRIVLVKQERPNDKQPLFRCEAIEIAARHGARAILFVNDRPGTTTLMGMSNFQGKPSPIPAFSVTFEEGKWIQRLLKEGTRVSVRITTQSHCASVETGNTVVTLPGKVKSKIVVGAHFDSWDMGQGAIDNGEGTAILLDVARLLRRFSPVNHYTIELVWFNGEELGLWGSRKYMEMHSADSIAAMINMDMTGTPTGFNAGGFDAFIPFFQSVVRELQGYDLKDSVVSVPGTNSDNQSFLLAGIPAFSLQSHLDEDQYKFYHELGDTFDKVNKRYLSDAAAVVSVMVRELANRPTLPYRRYSEKETVELLKKFKLDDHLKRTHEWPFQE